MSAWKSSAPKDISIFTKRPESRTLRSDRLEIARHDLLARPAWHSCSGALRAELIYFADCALKGRKPDIGRPEDATAALAATLAAEDSARSGKVVRLKS